VGLGWLELWAIARYDLGIGLGEFGELTLAQFEALLDRHHEAHRRRMAAAGVVAAAVYNSQRTKDSDPLVNAVDFIPASLSELSQADSEPEDEGELTLDLLAEFFGARKKPSVIQVRERKDG
jgi:hypothetical protein